MEFYQSVFGGELTINTFGEYGEKYRRGADLVMHSMLTTAGGFALMAADTPEGMEFTPGSQITISLSGDGDDAEAIRGYWEALSDGAPSRAAGEAGLGRRVRPDHRQVRHQLDGQHRRRGGLVSSRRATAATPAAHLGRNPDPAHLEISRVGRSADHPCNVSSTSPRSMSPSMVSGCSSASSQYGVPYW